MARRPRAHPTTPILERIRGDLEELVGTSRASPLTHPARRRIDRDVRTIMGELDSLLREIDPVRQPASMFDPADPNLIGRFVALGLLAQPATALSEIDQFYGSGVYAIYYHGDFSAYAPIKDTETPIYVGMANPDSGDAKTPMEQSQKLEGRLKDHRRNIGKAISTLDIDDFSYRNLVVQSGGQPAAETYLIHLFKPVWNNETGICYGLGKHGDAPSTRGNKRPPWDTLHPGRDWAHRDASMVDARPRDRILKDLELHFESAPIYESLDEVLRSFVDELSQV